MSIRFRSLKYLFSFTVPLGVYRSLSATDIYSYESLFILFILVPLVELLSYPDTKNMSALEEQVAKQDRFYDWLLYLMLPIQYLLLIYFLIQVSQENLPLYVRIGYISAFGISCGILGINVAHELGHRSDRFSKTLSKMLLLSSLYMHFFIEHNRGHHKRVSTDEDAASARFNEPIYFFFVRSIIGSWFSAWHLEKQRLEKKSQPFWSFANEMLWFQIFQGALLVSILWFFGWETLGYYFMAAFIGMLMLETVNYIEHYGLRRKKVGSSYERTMPAHSWNSNHPIGRLALFELSRHSDHHYSASRKYQILRHHDDGPQMPTGYPGMMLLALIPPIWFRVMNPKIAKSLTQ